MSITPEIEAEVLRLYRANTKRFSAFKAGRVVGISFNEVMTIVGKFKNSEQSGREHNGGHGRPDLQPFICASRRVDARGWNNDDAGVIAARDNFCAGTHTMATHRDGAWLHLCSIPLRRPIKPRPKYFSMGAA